MTELANDMDCDLDPRMVLLNYWVFAVRMYDYFSSGEGSGLFGDAQPIAVQASGRIRKRALSLAQTYFPGDRLSQVAREVETRARQTPIRHLSQINDDVELYTEETTSAKGALSWLVASPWRAVIAGKRALDPTAKLAESIDRFTDMLQDYPSLVRWQTELLWLQLEESDSISKTAGGIDDLLQSSVRLATLAEDLPERIGDEVRQLLDEVVANQPALHESLEKTQATAETLDDLLARAETVSSNIERSVSEIVRAGEVWEKTASAVTQTVEQIQKFGKPHEAAQPSDQLDNRPSEPFDIKEYTQTAEALIAASIELRSLLAEFREFLEGDSDRIEDLTASALGQASVELRGVIDLLSRRAAQSCLLIFVFAIILRVTWVRDWRSKRRSSQPERSSAGVS